MPPTSGPSTAIPVNAFGATLGVNRTVDEATAQAIVDTPFEAIVAPGFSEAALAVLAGKSDMQLLQVPGTPASGRPDYGMANLDFVRVGGGLLVETLDRDEDDRSLFQVVTHRRPTLEELTDLMFAWRCVRHVRSNAVVVARNAALVGVGAGQAAGWWPSRWPCTARANGPS